MTLVQYNDITLYELTILIEGYNVRWEEQWRHTRRLYTLIYNVNCDKQHQKKELDLMPFPSERAVVELNNRAEKRRVANMIKKHK